MNEFCSSCINDSNYVKKIIVFITFSIFKMSNRMHTLTSKLIMTLYHMKYWDVNFYISLWNQSVSLNIHVLFDVYFTMYQTHTNHLNLIGYLQRNSAFIYRYTFYLWLLKMSLNAAHAYIWFGIIVKVKKITWLSSLFYVTYLKYIISYNDQITL